MHTILIRYSIIMYSSFIIYVAPTGTVDHIRADILTDRVSIYWSFSRTELQNGPIRQYIIHIQEYSQEEQSFVDLRMLMYRNSNNGSFKFPDVKEHNYEVDGDTLKPGTLYRFKIAAQNVEGIGPFSDWNNLKIFTKGI